MSVTYTKIFETKFLDPFWAVLKGEMNIYISMDIDFIERGSRWFNLTIETDKIDSRRSGGQYRLYEVNLRYYQKWKAERDRNWYNVVTEIGEKVKRLIDDNSNTTNWHDMMISVNYNPDRGLPNGDSIPMDWIIVEFIITFRIEEVY